MDPKSWLRKAIGRGVKTPKRKALPDGVWIKCDGCAAIVYRNELVRNLWVCPRCDHHMKVGAAEYVALLTDEGLDLEIAADLVSVDPLKFKDSKSYKDRIKAATEKSGLRDAIVAGRASIDVSECALAVMDFGFIGGSMGSVVGEKVARTMREGLDRGIPVITVARSGGARMQEGILSLMQMAKTAAMAARLREARIPYISILTDPTTAGVMASYASLGDVIISEPGALLGFAGPRVIRDTIKQELPEGFQSSEFFLEHGMIDMIVPRTEMRTTVGRLLRHLTLESAKK
ncbi:MAG: acetyl-CoA carboxylase carboxyl transferase subunit beta [Gemmatimonadetes bacterium]|nr:acetyl-CoA carboxylase carboxyl transferase subunit beta [Gemmatimonadota bacterium]